MASDDVRALGPRFAVVGSLQFASSVICFSEGFDVADLSFASLTLMSSVSDVISCYECSAQTTLLYCASAMTTSALSMSYS